MWGRSLDAVCASFLSFSRCDWRCEWEIEKLKDGGCGWEGELGCGLARGGSGGPWMGAEGSWGLWMSAGDSNFGFWRNFSSQKSLRTPGIPENRIDDSFVGSQSSGSNENPSATSPQHKNHRISMLSTPQRSDWCSAHLTNVGETHSGGQLPSAFLPSNGSAARSPETTTTAHTIGDREFAAAERLFCFTFFFCELFCAFGLLWFGLFSFILFNIRSVPFSFSFRLVWAAVLMQSDEILTVFVVLMVQIVLGWAYKRVFGLPAFINPQNSNIFGKNPKICFENAKVFLIIKENSINCL